VSHSSKGAKGIRRSQSFPDAPKDPKKLAESTRLDNLAAFCQFLVGRHPRSDLIVGCELVALSRLGSASLQQGFHFAGESWLPSH
jgi:hypothetical protein